MKQKGQDSQWQKQGQALVQQLSGQPNNPSLQMQYADWLVEGNQFKPAIPHYEASLKLMSTSGLVWQKYAECCLKAGYQHKALNALGVICQNMPQNLEYFKQYCQTAMSAGENSQAINALSQKISATPADSDLRMLLIEALHNNGQTEDSIKVIQEGLSLDTNNEKLWLALALAYEDLGDKIQALEAFTKAIQLSPEWPFAIGSALSFAKEKSEIEWVDQAEKLSKKKLSIDDQANLAFGLAKYRHARKEYKEAFGHAMSANNARHKEAGNLNKNALDERASSIIKEFNSKRIEAFKLSGSQDNRPTLIVGMPRSGTSLIEQILATDSSVVGCGELPDLPHITKWLSEFSPSESSWPESSRSLTPRLIQAAAHRYLQKLDQFSASTTLKCIDKTPANFFHLGLFSSLFPKGKVIWARRNVIDVAVSIYFENFNHSQKYSTNLKDIAYYAFTQNRLMEHWLSTQQIEILEVTYESLIQDFDTQSKKIFDFLGLQWTDSIRDFHKTERAVTTPSRWQVRQPLYANAINKWKAYEEFLSPLLQEVEKLELRNE